MSQEFTKDPSEELDYVIDYSDYLGVGETISTSTWATATAITIMSDGAHLPSKTAETTTVWLSGGAVWIDRYVVTNTITTSAGRTVERSIYITAEDR